MAERIQERAESALAARGVFELRELRVEQLQGRLLISGSVSSFYHKQLAQEAVRAIAGELSVVNSVQVR